MLFHHVQELSHYASYSPYINWCTIILVKKYNLRGAIPPADDMFSKLKLLLSLKVSRISRAYSRAALVIDHTFVQILSIPCFFVKVIHALSLSRNSDLGTVIVLIRLNFLVDGPII